MGEDINQLCECHTCQFAALQGGVASLGFWPLDPALYIGSNYSGAVSQATASDSTTTVSVTFTFPLDSLKKAEDVVCEFLDAIPPEAQDLLFHVQYLRGTRIDEVRERIRKAWRGKP